MSMSECECVFHCCSILNDLFIQQNNPKYGGVAQLGEHLPCKQGVMGSIPIISTSGKLPHKTGEEKERDTPKTYMGS